MERTIVAKLVLIQIDAIQTGDFENRSIDRLALINELIRDAKQLAEETLATSNNEDKAA